jgi:hypothetical protein
MRALGQTGLAAGAALVQLAADAGASENARWSAIVLLGEMRYAPGVGDLVRLQATETKLRAALDRTLQAITGLELDEDGGSGQKALDSSGFAPAPELAAPLALATAEAKLALVQEALADVAMALSWEPPGYVYVRRTVAGGRKQQILISFEPDVRTGQESVLFYTECGLATPAVADAIARRNLTTRFGEFRVEKGDAGTEKVAFRYWLARNRVSASAVREVVLSMTEEADALEFELHGTDTV